MTTDNRTVLEMKRERVATLESRIKAMQEMREWVSDQMDEAMIERLRLADHVKALERDAPAPDERMPMETQNDLVRVEGALRRATELAEHLFQMIDRETWRATGGDDGQGHYEGDYRAEKIAEEIRELKSQVEA